MKSFGLTDKGAVRKDNQDSFIIEKCDARDCLIVALCDGMGGAKAGGFASRLANKAFVSHIYGKLTSRVMRAVAYPQLLKEACEDANGVAYEYSRFDEAYRGMGTTLVGGVIKNNGNGYIINVGDSRAYLMTPGKSVVTQITKDHSLVQEFIDVGAITKEQAKTHPQKNVITRAIGSDETVAGDVFTFTLRSDDLLLLCSDGLSNVVGDDEMLECAEKYHTPETLCRALMDKALSRGAPDNVTVVIAAM
ncbi:MAG: Stp1/IreP family PP2C-type Ser/Thr phosphatase [Eubacteriales bacterium]|nr:Stp1/IreP family PP2C-type Ser/Thr phosphatase [Eubacteriales bacterium]